MLWQWCAEYDESFLFFPLKVTASGDQTAKVWDVRAGELLGICKGHQCSLKSVAFSRFEKGKLAFPPDFFFVLLLSHYNFYPYGAKKGLWNLLVAHSTDGLSSDLANVVTLQWSDDVCTSLISGNFKTWHWSHLHLTYKHKSGNTLCKQFFPTIALRKDHKETSQKAPKAWSL